MVAAIKVKEVDAWPETAVVVERRRHISELKGWRRRLLRAYFVWGGRFVYLVLGLPVPDVYGVWKEGQAIAIDHDPEEAKKRAAEMCEDESWFFQELPVNRSLPAETAQFKAHSFPKTVASRWFEKRQLEYLTVKRSTLAMFDKDIDKVNETFKT